MQRPPWRSGARLSSVADAAEGFLARAGFDRGPWLAVALGAGIAAWFALPWSALWVAAMALGIVVALAALALWRGSTARVQLTLAGVSLGMVFAFGVSLVWLRSEMAGAEPIARPASAELTGRILDRIEQPADARVRLVLATREPGTGRAIKVRVNVPQDHDLPELGEGAVVRLRARLLPPAPPMLPGAYDFARTAWFDGLAATGSAQGPVTVLQPAPDGGGIGALQRRLSAHVRSQLDGSPGAIAAAFASGDRGAIAEADEQAMRDSGLTHLLSISGLHVSAVIGAAYFLAMRLLALWSWLALRVRLPLAAAAIGAMAGIGYTLLTGSEVPTMRSCIGALLVLAALALGRQPLSLRMVAVAAAVVLLLWPESLAGPSFQMSFAAVIALVALHESGPVRAFLAPREQGWLVWGGRHMAVLLLAGVAIELTLMPIVLFHFHRAGVYGALANLVAIPLVTFVSMPLIALALVLDLAGVGGPVWWAVGKSLELLLWIAHLTAAQPGAVKLMPHMGTGTFALFVLGGLWLALWRGRARLWGTAPVALATILLLATPVPDLLIAGDGRQLGVAGEGDRLLVLHETRSDFTRDNLLQLAGREGELLALAEWPGALCSRDFCLLELRRAGRHWTVLASRSDTMVDAGELAAACASADLVVSNRWLPRTCQPRWLKADRALLRQTGGLAIVLDGQRVQSVHALGDDHPWVR